jgi:hypothetical protein
VGDMIIVHRDNEDPDWINGADTSREGKYIIALLSGQVEVVQVSFKLDLLEGQT